MKEEEQDLEEKANGKKVVLMTYNSVDGFPAGEHADGRLLVFSWDKRGGERRAPGIAKDITDQFYDRFDLRRDGDQFEHIFVYAGINAIDEAIRAASVIGHDLKRVEEGKRVTLVACRCDADRKREVAHRSHYVDYIPCECGGEATMGVIARAVLRGDDPREIEGYHGRHRHR